MALLAADNAQVFLLLLSTAANLVLALLVLRAARGAREEARIFSVLAISVALWCFTNAGFQLATSSSSATLWAQLAYGSALTTAASFLHFAWTYPRRVLVPPRLKAALWSGATAITVLSFVPGAVIRSIDLDSRRILTAPGVFLIALYMLGVSALAFRLFTLHQTRLRGRARAQARFVLYGSAVTAVLGLTFNLFLPLAGDYRFVALGPLASLFFVGFSGYSIAAHHLFDVRVLIRRTLVYSVLIALIACTFGAVEKGLEVLLRPLLGHEEGYLTEMLATFLIALAVEPVKRWLKDRVSKWLFKNEKGELQTGEDKGME